MSTKSIPRAQSSRSTRRVSPETRPVALAEILEQARTKGLAASGKGEVSSQIPGLDAVPPERFGFSVALIDGTTVSTGDATVPFSLQSITKLFSLAALLQLQPDVWPDIGWEPTEASFRSLAELEHRDGRPRNPFVNAGAIVVADKLRTLTGSGFLPTLQMIREQSGNARIGSVSKVARAEFGNSHINMAIAHMLADSGSIDNPIVPVLKDYFQQCAIAASTEDVARATLFLARRNADHPVLSFENRRRVNAVLLTAGMYNAAGDIAYRVGLPVKSGIGGGIVGVLPGVGAVCLWSPPLDRHGNSAGGIAALEEFSRLAGWSLF